MQLSWLARPHSSGRMVQPAPVRCGAAAPQSAAVCRSYGTQLRPATRRGVLRGEASEDSGAMAQGSAEQPGGAEILGGSTVAAADGSTVAERLEGASAEQHLFARTAAPGVSK